MVGDIDEYETARKVFRMITTLSDANRYLGLGNGVLKHYKQAGRITFTKRGGAVLVDTDQIRKELEEWTVFKRREQKLAQVAANAEPAENASAS